MTQPFASDNDLPSTPLASGREGLAEDNTELSATLQNSQQPAILHPNFDPTQTPLDPARSLSDIPEPARRANSQLRRLYGKSIRFHDTNNDTLSKWQLMASEPFAEHLALLSAAKLIALPDSFYRPYHSQNAQPLLTSLESMTLLDMADIQQVISHYPKLTRYGFSTANSPIEATVNNESIRNTANSSSASMSLREVTRSYNPDELLSSLYADDWQVALQPQQFETGLGSLPTDIMVCSVAVHALKQCATRKSVNQSYSAEQICQHLRSYLLGQIVSASEHRCQYRQIRLFTGHIIAAAYHLGWDMQVCDDGHCYFNISSRCGLLTRYANMNDYHINGWSS